MIYAILATGPSMSQALADSVRGKAKVIAVSDSYRLAPWADVLAASDRGWWRLHEPDFEGKKLCGVPVHGIERIEGAVSGSNSGLLAIQAAVQMGAKTVLLLGYDMGASKGDHFFGSHPAPLRNTKPDRFEVFKKQFSQYQPKGVRIWNCTEGSALTCYPMARLEDVLNEYCDRACDQTRRRDVTFEV